MSGFSTPASDQTYAAWILVTGSSNFQAIFGSGNGSTGGPEFRVNQLTSQLQFLAESVASIGTSTGTITQNVWQHVLVTYNNSTFATQFFANGVSIGTASSGSGLTSGRTLAIGRNDASASEFFGGNISDAAAWNLILDSDEIRALGTNNARPGGVSRGLIGWWPLAGTQSPEPDLSGSGNSGTLTGTASAPDPPINPPTFIAHMNASFI